MKRTTVTTLVANLRRAAARCLDRISGKATRTDSQSQGTSRIDDGATTVALCPDVTGVWSLAVLLIGSLFAATSLPAAEQDNWYLADEWNIPTFNVYQDMGVAYFFDDEVERGRMYVCEGWGSGSEIRIYELNGTLARSVQVPGQTYYMDVAVDTNGTMIVGEGKCVTAIDRNGSIVWRTGKNASLTSGGSDGSGDGEFKAAKGIALGSNGEVFVADKSNHRIQVLDKNGTFLRKFGASGSAPGQLDNPTDLAFLPDGTLVVGDDNFLHYFNQDGTFLKRTNADSARGPISIAKDGTIFCRQRLRDSDGNTIKSIPEIDSNSRTCFTPEGDLFESKHGSSQFRIRIWKRAYRTKGLATRNVIPQPAIRGIGQ